MKQSEKSGVFKSKDQENNETIKMDYLRVSCSERYIH